MSGNIICISDLSIKLLKCRKCSSVTTNSLQPYLQFCNCFRCICSNTECNEYWFICVQHQKRFASSKLARMYDHFVRVDHSELDISDIKSSNGGKSESSSAPSSEVSPLFERRISSSPNIHPPKCLKRIHESCDDENSSAYPE